ncbi:DNA repair protein RecO [Ferrimonas lipolytica]|uniref:DNA repair protein RecO n=1 Tax=Ferrimonas lipolytica TaxID=2724191 RepID=A0A6H1UF97_9GAMM|nr:DNA repair protein RecO [Ferrimonas lipolytica]QIZ77498.1 DNA repair protein RecO [Ferrimonas lipolytica]
MATTEPLSRAYLLHARPYKESSLLLDLLTEDHGRIAAVARIGGKTGAAKKAQLQPFRPLKVGLSGRSTLRNLAQLEAPSMPLPLTGTALYSGLYLNELCQRTLPEWQECATLFEQYQQSLIALASEAQAEANLRYFELALLQHLGQIPALEYDASSQPLSTSANYLWQAGQGFIATIQPNHRAVSGAMLLAWSDHQLLELEHLRQAKHLIRALLQPLLGNKPLHSRTLFNRQRGRHEHTSGR